MVIMIWASLQYRLLFRWVVQIGKTNRSVIVQICRLYQRTVPPTWRNHLSRFWRIQDSPYGQTSLMAAILVSWLDMGRRPKHNDPSEFGAAHAYIISLRSGRFVSVGARQGQWKTLCLFFSEPFFLSYRSPFICIRSLTLSFDLFSLKSLAEWRITIMRPTIWLSWKQ